MSEIKTIGLLGFGGIGKALYGFIQDDPMFELKYAFVRSPKNELTTDQQLTDPSQLSEIPIDLCVEAAAPEVVEDVGEIILNTSDLMVLSGSALIDPNIEERLTSTAERNDTTIYLPHAALLGIDGLVDARETLDEVSIKATKSPDYLDFSYTDEFDREDVDKQTVLYDGSVRGLCQLFPRDFNSHATIGLASLGLDATRSKLLADPDATGARHTIRASGEGFDLKIVRESALDGFTSDYTPISTWGSIQRIVADDSSMKFV